MKQILILILIVTFTQGYSQVFFSKVYSVPEDGSGFVNQYPNWISAVFPTDSLIYAFGYSADTTYKDIYGTAFYTFDWSGNLLDYYHIKDDSLHNFFYPEGIHTWDGITFYTGFNHHNKQESILKFIRITRAQKAFEIKNSIYPGGSIVYNNMSTDPSGFIITASKVGTGIANQWRKVQVTKIDTLGNLIWQKIIGKEPITTYDNVPYSSYIDVNGFIYIGIGYSDIAYTGIKHDYESLLFKLNPEGKLVNSYNSKRFQGFCDIYDIIQDGKGTFYLSSNFNYDYPQYPYSNQGFGIVQIVDSSLIFKDYIQLDFRYNGTGPAWLFSFEKIIRSNKNDGVIVGGTIPIKNALIQFTDSIQRVDTIIGYHELLNLVKINDFKQIEWRKIYRIRNGKDDGYLHDIKSCPTGGYIIAAASYLDDAFEKNGDRYYMPWLLKVDDDGCLIPGCGIVNNKDIESNKR
ncbi:MAG: hypothetical protein IPO86_08560 [Saprospiraceae bacterium]|nr:hypothetical protein [Saprospiraceae bacterium]MBK9728151.1 hypothetical protein [Saprospiraceae bacterium]